MKAETRCKESTRPQPADQPIRCTKDVPHPPLSFFRVRGNVTPEAHRAPSASQPLGVPPRGRVTLQVREVTNTSARPQPAAPPIRSTKDAPHQPLIFFRVRGNVAPEAHRASATRGCRRPHQPAARAARAAIAAMVAVLLALATPPPAAAVVPVTDYAHIAVNQYWHLAHYAQFATEIYQQVQALTNQARQITYQLQALRKLANPS
jgi:hypothetical protein